MLQVGGGDAVVAQVLEVERPQQVGGLALAGVGDVVDVGERELEVDLGVLCLAGGGLGHGQVLHQPPVELRVEVPAGAMYRQVVQLLGGERVESVVVRAGRHRPILRLIAAGPAPSRVPPPTVTTRPRPTNKSNNTTGQLENPTIPSDDTTSSSETRP